MFVCLLRFLTFLPAFRTEFAVTAHLRDCGAVAAAVMAFLPSNKRNFKTRRSETLLRSKTMRKTETNGLVSETSSEKEKESKPPIGAPSYKHALFKHARLQDGADSSACLYLIRSSSFAHLASTNFALGVSTQRIHGRVQPKSCR